MAALVKIRWVLLSLALDIPITFLALSATGLLPFEALAWLPPAIAVLQVAGALAMRLRFHGRVAGTAVAVALGSAIAWSISVAWATGIFFSGAFHAWMPAGGVIVRFVSVPAAAIGFVLQIVAFIMLHNADRLAD